jgi:hypothetical protein
MHDTGARSRLPRAAPALRHDGLELLPGPRCAPPARLEQFQRPQSAFLPARHTQDRDREHGERHMAALYLLRDARQLLADETNWCQHHAVHLEGAGCLSSAPSAIGSMPSTIRIR